MPVHDVFSKRDTPLPDVFQYDTIPEKLRNQIIWIWNHTLERISPINELVYKTIHDIVCTEHGLPGVNDPEPVMRALYNNEMGVVQFLLRKHPDTLVVLDIIEQSVFKMRQLVGMGRLEIDEFNAAISELNHRFRENEIGYEFNSDAQKLVRIDNLLTHTHVVQPSLHLLADPKYTTANTEYLEAFDDYKNSDWDDCITKTGAAFESFLELVCVEKGWSYITPKKASNLIDVVVDNAGLDSFMKASFTTIASIRNKHSTAHGGGKKDTPPPPNIEQIAKYALHSTASAILMIHDSV